MAKTTKTVREVLSEKVKDLKYISVNGIPYFGKKEKKDGVNIISEAVEAEGSITETARKWIKAYNLGELQQLEIEGDAVAFATKNLTEAEQIEVELVILSAAKAEATSVANLINNNF